MKSSITLDITPCTPLKVNRRLVVTCRFHLQGEASIDLQRITRRYIPEDKLLVHSSSHIHGLFPLISVKKKVTGREGP
jgi:hypothetical protein